MFFCFECFVLFSAYSVFLFCFVYCLYFCIYSRLSLSLLFLYKFTERWILVENQFIHSFIHSFIVMCRMLRFLAVLSSSCHSSLLCTLSLHPVPPTSLSSFLISSCHLFLGLPLGLFVSKFILNTFWGGNFIFFHSLHMSKPSQSLLFYNLRYSRFFDRCINFSVG